MSTQNKGAGAGLFSVKTGMSQSLLTNREGRVEMGSVSEARCAPRDALDNSCKVVGARVKPRGDNQNFIH